MISTNYYIQINEAKRSFGYIRRQVSDAIKNNSGYKQQVLAQKIKETIKQLEDSIQFFKAIGSKCSVDLYIIAYQALLARLNLSIG